MIIGIVLGVIILGVICYKIITKKRQSEQSSNEYVVNTKVQRTSEVVKVEFLAEIDALLASNRNQFEEYLVKLEASVIAINSSKKIAKQNFDKFEKLAIEHKVFYEKDGDELDKTKAMQYIKHLKSAENSMINLELRSKEIAKKLEIAEFEHQNVIATLENKRVEIISEINPILNLNQSEFSLDDLEREFDEKVEAQNIANEVDEEMKKMNCEDVIPNFEVEYAFTKLKSQNEV